jgi:hypothetical protein
MRDFGSVSANHLAWTRKEERQNNTNQSEGLIYSNTHKNTTEQVGLHSFHFVCLTSVYEHRAANDIEGFTVELKLELNATAEPTTPSKLKIAYKLPMSVHFLHQRRKIAPATRAKSPAPGGIFVALFNPCKDQKIETTKNLRKTASTIARDDS